MLAVIRVILVMLLSIFICTFGLVYCLFSPRNPRHVAIFSRWFSCMSSIFGLQIEVRRPKSIALPKNCIYIANHQNNYDIVTASHVVQPRTVIVGKKSLLWIPFFGLLYWITGNLFIDRDNSAQTHNDLMNIVKSIKKKNISIWIFPEGTRSRGRGLLSFKSGAFYTAIAANVPIVPICISNTSNKIKLNRRFNGLVVIEILSPIDTSSYSWHQIKELTKYCRILMKIKLDTLNEEVTRRESIKFS